MPSIELQPCPECLGKTIVHSTGVDGYIAECSFSTECKLTAIGDTLEEVTELWNELADARWLELEEATRKRFSSV